jgi:hypothetical protein
MKKAPMPPKMKAPKALSMAQASKIRAKAQKVMAGKGSAAGAAY